jgi:biopolymer transport protein ExbD
MKSHLKAFDFTLHIEKDSFSIDFAPLLDLCMIVGLFVWLSSRFTFSPGIPLDLPRSGENLRGIPCAAVLTVAGKNEIFLEGDRYQMNEIAPVLRTVVAREKHKGGVSLLLKMNKISSMATLLKLCEIALSAGVQSIQLASESADMIAPNNFISPE